MKTFNRRLIFLMFAILLLCALSLMIFDYESHKQSASLFSDSSKEILQPKEIKTEESENNSNPLNQPESSSPNLEEIQYANKTESSSPNFEEIQYATEEELKTLALEEIEYINYHKGKRPPPRYTD